MANNNIHILIVDDDDRIRALLKDYLSSKNYIVSSAENADEAKKKIEYLKYNNKVQVEYVLYPEAFSNKIGGDIQISPKPINFEIVSQSDNELIFLSPEKKGAYRIFAYVKNENGQSSVANIPFLVE